jgi:hypothetical protein
MLEDLVHALLDEGTPVRWLLVERDGTIEVDAPPGEVALLPGSFNPLHHGHTELAGAASEVLGREVVFELAVVNVDKPPLDVHEVARRAAQFAGESRLLLTSTPRFVEKARLFPGRPFVIGWDTAERLVQPRYYRDSVTEMRAALREMHETGAHFVVGGRAEGSAFRTLDDIALPEGFASMFSGLPEHRFRIDISSTELRTS